MESEFYEDDQIRDHDDNIEYMRRKQTVMDAEYECAQHQKFQRIMKRIYVTMYVISFIIFTLIGHYAPSDFTLFLFNFILAPFAAISAFVIANDL